ncbi:MAG: glycosyltransferase family 2 protein [Lachnospiraceae bacterium]|nr:glycosyltransferase family 2 protein [Lachnospiraceae bacterium]
MEKFSISVIVPVYNTEKYLGRCIDSLLKQTLPIRIILVDDGSTDNSGAICDKYAEQNQCISVLHKSNGGAGSAKNAGLSIVNTDFVGFVDSDDWVTDDMFEYLNALQSKYQADIVQIEYITVKDDKNISICSRKERIFCLDDKEDILERYLLDGMKPVKSYSTCTKIYRKSLFDEVKFPEVLSYDDVTTNYDLLTKAKRYLISNKQCYYYYVREVSITKGLFSTSDLDYVLSGEQIVSRTENSPRLKKLGNMTLARFHFTNLCKLLKFGCEPDIDYKELIRTSIPVIRSGMTDLLKSGMKMDRKIIMLVLSLNIKLTIFYARRRIAKLNTN